MLTETLAANKTKIIIAQDESPRFLTSAFDVDEWLVRHLPLFTRGNVLWYLLGWRLGGPQSRFEICGVQKYLLPLTGIKHWASRY
jgi:hypothetical protein